MQYATLCAILCLLYACAELPIHMENRTNIKALLSTTTDSGIDNSSKLLHDKASPFSVKLKLLKTQTNAKKHIIVHDTHKLVKLLDEI